MTDQPTAGVLLRQARQRAELSARRAAELAGVSEGLWRQTELGYRSVGQGLTVPVKTSPERLRRMAEAVNADIAAVLRAAGHEADGPVSAPPEAVPVEIRRLAKRAAGLSSENRDRWLRLARALADALAGEVDRQTTGTPPTNLRDMPSDDSSLRVQTDRFTAANGEIIVQADAGELARQSQAEREYVDTLSDDALERLKQRLLGE